MTGVSPSSVILLNANGLELSNQKSEVGRMEIKHYPTI
jgi:hypothetical protein